MTSTTIAELTRLLQAKGYRQVADEVRGNIATYVFVNAKDDFVTITGPVDHPAEVVEGNSARGFLESLLKSLAGRADCGCVHHAEQGIPCEHDLAQHQVN
jgi:hypothetical protein